MGHTPAAAPPLRGRGRCWSGCGRALCYHHLSGYPDGLGDFAWPLRGAQLLISGADPYHPPSGTYPHDYPLFYPVPALFFVLPFVWLPPSVAGAAFFGVSSGLLAFGLSRAGWFPLLTLFGSAFYGAAFGAQSAPLITAAAAWPPLFGAVVVKPTLGLAAAVAFPNRTGFVVAAFLLLAGLIVRPTWPLDMVNNAGEGLYLSPLLVLPGPLLLLALPHWRLPSARLLMAMSVVPQFLGFYDQVPLWLIPRSSRQFVVLTAASWVSFLGWNLARQWGPLGLWHPKSCVLGRRLFVLARPGVGDVAGPPCSASV